MSNIPDDKQIFLIRHGQSTGNGRGCLVGWTDHPLEDVGRDQATAVGARLAPLGPMPVACSDLQRARETAEIIAAHWQGAVQPDARWREICCGDYEDRPWAEFSANTALASLFDVDPLGTCVPGGESVLTMQARVLAAFTDVLANPAPRVAIVAHDGPIRAVLAHCLQIPASRFWAITTHHGGITTLRYAQEWVSVLCVNDTSHLAELSAPLSTG